MKALLFCILFFISTFSSAQQNGFKWWKNYVSQKTNIDIEKKELWYQKELKNKNRTPRSNVRRKKKIKTLNIKDHLNNSKNFRTDTIIFKKYIKNANNIYVH